MFEFQVMTGAFAFAFFKLSVSFALIFIVAYLGYSLYYRYKIDKENFVSKNKFPIGFLAFVIVMSFVFLTNSTIQPKRAIDLPINREQVEYDSGKDIEIVTPQERTQRLDGFTPLGSN